MASSSSSKPTGGWTYEAFVSFRGKDTRYTFVDHLNAALVRTGINVFEDEKIPRGRKAISEELVKAIKVSRCAVVVFSKHYADSSWCLKELAKIMECRNRIGQIVIPVFYHVDPSDVRGLKNDFGTAFRQHEQKFKEEEMKEWREALTAAANLPGYHISETVKEGESTVTNNIVEQILRITQPNDMEEGLTGIESHINKLCSLLDIEERCEVRMVGIHGMGGMGKTTIAKALFRRIAYKFEGSSFVKAVRENSSNHRDVCALQKQILTDVLETHQESRIKDPEDGAKMIQTRFCRKKVLLVLDDVDDIKQLEFLAARHNWFGKGSRIIITTRDERLLSDTNSKYKPDILLEEQAVELFSRHAFRKNSPPKGYEQVSNRAIRYTGRLPLALKVLGSFFHGRELGVWESALNRLAKTPNKEIFDILKISFDGLEDSEKQIFLDIACFFKGRDREYMTRVLDSFGFDSVIGISVLIQKSLITVSNKSLGMHDLIQEMGMQIFRKSYPWSRIWGGQEFLDLIKEHKLQKLEALEAIVVSSTDYFLRDVSSEDTSSRADVFKNMKNLRLLDVYGNFTSCEPNFLPNELRWVRWRSYRFSTLPIGNLHNLVGLELTFGNIRHLSIGNKVLPCLKFIDLHKSYSLERLPDVSWAPNVERLILFDCRNMEEVDESLGSLKRLVYLDMSGCENLKCLPYEIKMESLETLILTDCRRLEKFPKVSPCMMKLSKIKIHGCSEKLKVSIPSSIRRFCTSRFSAPDSPILRRLREKSLQNKTSKLPTSRVSTPTIIESSILDRLRRKSLD